MNKMNLAVIRRAGAVSAAALLIAASASVQALDISLPGDTVQYQPSDLPGYTLALQNCATCHSAQYVQSQPPGSPRAYWDATVKKMKHPFGAPVDDADLPAIVDYLVKTYGAERKVSAATPVAAAPTTSR